MSNILTIAYSVEGATDVRFLEGIIQRTFEEIALSCDTDIEVFPLSYIRSPGLDGFVENTKEIARIASCNGIHVLCIHTDADSDNDQKARLTRINPAFSYVQAAEDGICKNLVAVVPVQMSESWMLCDKDLLKDEIRTTKSNQDLGIARKPELIADPKHVIEEAIRVAQVGYPAKRRGLGIGSLYQPLGQKISLASLRGLASYRQFYQEVQDAFRRLNYIR